MLKFLFFGDIVGKIGRRAIQKSLPKLRKKYKPDLVIANAENLSHGKGATLAHLQEMQKAGIDFFTSGNHIWAKKEITSVLENKKFPLIRPANYPPAALGAGWKIIKIRQKLVLVINLIGRVFFREDFDCPFRKIDEILASQKEKFAAILIDFHAEATSEKVAFGFYVDGRVSAVLGTHTHIPTADQRILPLGTAFVADIGMVGGRDSIIGVEKNIIIKHYLDQLPFPHEIPEKGPSQVNAVYLEIDPKTKKAIKIKRADSILNC